jgi:small-conductance mechanosensitive channel
VADLKRGLDNTYSTNLESRIAAINLKYKEQEEALKKLRDASPLGDKARFDTQIAALPALRTREIGQATGKALEAQADAAVAARNDLVNSANKLRDAGAISIDEQQQKIKDAYALTTPEIEKATAALEEWIKTAKEFGATDLDIEKVKAKIAELRVEAKYVDPFLKVWLRPSRRALPTTLPRRSTRCLKRSAGLSPRLKIGRMFGHRCAAQRPTFLPVS